MRTSSVKSAERVLDLLELMAALPGALTLSEAARRLAIPKSSASGLFATLIGRGYVEAGPDGYRLAARLRVGGWVGGEYGQLVRIARPVMQELAARTGESAFLGIMTSDWRVQYIAKVTSEQPLRYDVDLGALRPAYCTSIGLVLLADRPDPAVERFLATTRLEQFTPHTVVDPVGVRALIARVRRQGYVALANSTVAGTSGVGAPVRGASSRVIAGLAVIAPSARFCRRGERAVREQAIDAVCAAAGEISRRLAALGSLGPQAGGEGTPPRRREPLGAS